MSTTPNFETDVLETNTQFNELKINLNQKVTESLAQLTVQSFTVTDPSTLTPTDGQVWSVATSAIGDWAGEDGNLAFYSSGWRFITPKAGWLAADAANAYALMQYNGTVWAALETGGGTVP